MDKRLFGLVAGVGLAFAAGAASAAPLSIISGAGLEDSCTYGAGSGLAGACATQNITPHPAWNPAPPAPPGYGGAWVSYADTGYQQGTLAPRNGSATNPNGQAVIFSITETFNGAGALDFWVWADDTVNLYLDGVLKKAANFTDGTCAIGSVGCEPGEHFNLVEVVGAGAHEIKVEVFQFGTGTDTTSNPFGLLYSGQFTPNEVPEPATLALLGAGLLGLGMIRRRRAH